MDANGVSRNEQLEREAEMGRHALAYVNYLELRRKEDRGRLELIRRVGRELVEEWRGQKARAAARGD